MTLLLLTLWPAPIPIVHCHAEDALRVYDQQLVQHLVKHHGGFANAGEWPTEWHWHWVYSGDSYVGPSGEKVVAAAEQLLAKQPLEFPEPSCSCPVEMLTLHRGNLRARATVPRGTSFQSVALMHSRQSLPELLGIMRL